MKYREKSNGDIVYESSWDFSENNDEIIVKNWENVIMRIGMAEVIDSIKPEFIMGHIYNNIQPCEWNIGTWKEYFSEKLVKKLEQ